MGLASHSERMRGVSPEVKPEGARMGQGEIISAGCDWITATTTNIDSTTSLSLWAAQVYKYERSLGNYERTWGMAGFSGFACGQIQLGVRGDEYIVRLSGDLAQRSWHELYKRAERITRFDVQVTHRNGREPRARIRTHHKQALRFSARAKRGPYVTLITGNDGSDTLYLGRRTSDVYGRVYAKGVLSKLVQHEGCVRYEVEFKNRLAMLVARDMAANGGHAPRAAARVEGFMQKRGLSTGITSSPLSPIGVSSRPADVLRSLEWLRKSCSSSVHAILAAGLHDELLAAFGVEIFNGKLRRNLYDTIRVETIQ